MKQDRQDLQSWYREAMLGRIDDLVALRDGVARASTSACDELRGIAQALRGSGGTFGFPELSAAAGVVEATSDAEASRRLEGLLVELRLLVGEKRNEKGRRYEWLAASAGLESSGAVEVDFVSVANAWTTVATAAGMTDVELTGVVADRFNLGVARLTDGSRAARQLVPEAFMESERVVPLVEDSATITVASADPVSLPTELELRRLTGRRPVFVVAAPSALRDVVDGPGKVKSPDADGSERPEHPPPPSTPRHADVLPLTGGRMADGPVEVLVVDDDAASRLLIRTLLEKRGFETVEASDGLEALEVIGEHDDIGLAVVDLNMPRMDGLELIWELREARRWATLPVIVVTGEKDEVLETQMMEEGADDYIRKPVDPRLFLARVEAALRRARHGSVTRVSGRT